MCLPKNHYEILILPYETGCLEVNSVTFVRTCARESPNPYLLLSSFNLFHSVVISMLEYTKFSKSPRKFKRTLNWSNYPFFRDQIYSPMRS